jgi:hypothetical protein
MPQTYSLRALAVEMTGEYLSRRCRQQLDFIGFIAIPDVFRLRSFGE